MLRFLHQSWREKCQTLEALGLVAAARLLLVAVPFRKTVALAGFLSARLPARSDGSLPQLMRLSDRVQRVSSCVPGATCLTQALALKLMLTRRRVTCRLRIGVAKELGGAFKAHAWVETRSSQVIIGGDHSPEQYKPLKFDLEKSA